MLAEIAGLGERGFPRDAGRPSLPTADLPGEATESQVNLGDRRTRRSQPSQPSRTLVLRFHTTPTRVVGSGRVEGLEVRRGGATEVIEAGLVVRSVGFRATPVPGLPFDEATGTVPHERGRVEPGTYVVGWIKRGPRGFIGTNKSDATETVGSILDDLDAGLPAPRAVPGPLPGAIGLDGWRAIDAEERRRGEVQGRTRGTIVDLDELRRIAAEAEHPTHAPERRGRVRPERFARLLLGR
jgi:ferredoxin--NADP+ reductase